MMSNAFILMTALPPTIGHEALVRFGSEFARNNKLTVIISSRSHEPMSGPNRVSSFVDLNLPNVKVELHAHDEAPQNPPETNPGPFWDYWKSVVRNFGFKPGDYIIASEMYGAKLADELRGIFIPFDIHRTIVPVTGTHTRQDIVGLWDNVMPTAKRYLGKKIVFFGAESTGKTTLSKYVAKQLGMEWRPEWARPYLEAVGEELNQDKMYNIIHGQYAIQQLPSKTYYTIYDTDLFSTVGYSRIYNGKSDFPRLVDTLAKNNKADLYVVMNSKVPFVPDPLRYGIDKRESDDQFWLDICDEFELPYVYLNATETHRQFIEVLYSFKDDHDKFANFVR